MTTATRDADLILHNGLITTLSSDETVPAETTAIALRGDRVLAVGSDAELEAAHRGPSTRMVDLEGRRVVPGLIDSHVHFVRAGRTWNDEVRWEDVYDLADGLAAITARAAEIGPGRWIRVIGGWDERQFAGGRGPSRAELDAAAPQNPVYVQMQYSYAVFNTLGMTELGLDEAGVAASPDPAGFERDETGALTGRGDGMPLMTWFYAKLPAPTLAEQTASTAALSVEFARLGMTGAIDGGGVNTGPSAYGPIHGAWRDGELKTRVRLFKHSTAEGTEDEDFAGYLRFESPGFGDDVLRMSGMGEVILFRSHDRIAAPGDVSDEAMAETKALFLRFAERGWAVQVHVHQREYFLRLLDVMEEVHRVHPIDELRWGFVHAESTYAEDIPRLRALGIGMLFQSLLRLNGEEAIAVWGAERVARSPELRDLLDAGIPVGLGSDAMRVASYNPWSSLEWFLTGLTVTGTPTLAAPHLISREEALRGYTHGGAWFTREEELRGRLVPGQLADLAVLSDDYFTIPVEEIRHLSSVLTLLGGEPVWDGAGLLSGAHEPVTS
ncbi:amidohydrolase [Agromyces mediolanus]|uniref:amidohydrolase n=1 Tax=Agromyces mediolanus TaxID=41986 RepID=UPI0020420EFB|nr:amidohydrolase [Agromyces mediolanus]MCM3657784.1 amidohydrolase [Agromyces mediolanus]